MRGLAGSGVLNIVAANFGDKETLRDTKRHKRSSGQKVVVGSLDSVLPSVSSVTMVDSPSFSYPIYSPHTSPHSDLAPSKTTLPTPIFAH